VFTDKYLNDDPQKPLELTVETSHFYHYNSDVTQIPK